MIQKASITISDQVFEVNLASPQDISIPLKEGDHNPNCFWAEDPVFEVIRGEGFVGSVAEGGSVNYKKLIMTPHGNGTHTECFGHIDADPQATISKKIKSFLAPLALVSVNPTKRGDEQWISQDQFPSDLPSWITALAVRTLPNDDSKRTQKYSGSNPVYFEPGFLEHVTEHGIVHFLTDLPSVDPEVDGGKLSSHKAFWKDETRGHCSITEMIFASDDIKDGYYLLNLQIPNINLDAVPSRPVLFPMTKV